MAFIARSTFRDKDRWKICWQDATKGAGKSGRRWASCSHGRHEEAFVALGLNEQQRLAFVKGATNNKLRERLCKAYEALEKIRASESDRAGGYGRGPRYDTPLTDLLDRYVDEIRAQVEVRKKRKDRSGKAPNTLEVIEVTIDRFKEFLASRRLTALTTGGLTSDLLSSYKAYLSSVESKHTNKPLAPTSVNRHLRTFKTVLRHFLDDDDSSPYFRITERTLKKRLSYVPENRPLPEWFPADQLRSLLEAAIKLDSQESKVAVKRRKNGRLEEFTQTAVNRSPLFPWAVFLMLTGCRVHEAAGTKWNDVDFDRGTITLRSKKTGAERRLLLDDDRYQVSHVFLSLLKRWRDQRPDSEYVLPETSRDDEERRPVWPKHPWAKLCEKAGVKIKAKALRSNWVSYMVSMGVPTAIVAMWAGHSPAVLERNYLDFVHERIKGVALDEALGVSDLISGQLRKNYYPTESNVPNSPSL